MVHEVQRPSTRDRRRGWGILWLTLPAAPTGESPLYVALALPGGSLRPGSRRLALALWGFVAYLFATWWLLTHRLDRFWLPLLPPLAVLAGLGADWARNRGWSIVLGAIMTLALVTNLTYISTALAGLNDWTGDLVFMRRDYSQTLERCARPARHRVAGKRASPRRRPGGRVPPRS